MDTSIAENSSLWKFKWGIRVKLILLFIMFGILTLLSGIPIIHLQEKEVKFRYGNGLQSNALIISNEITNVILTNLNLLQQQANFQLNDIVRATQAVAPEDVWHLLGERLVEQGGSLKLSFMISPAGEVTRWSSVFNSEGISSIFKELHFTPEQWFNQSFSSGENNTDSSWHIGTAIVGHPFHNEKLVAVTNDPKHYYLPFGVPIYHGKLLKGIWVACIDFEVIERIITFHRGLLAGNERSTVQVTLIDSSGGVITDFNPSYMITEKNGKAYYIPNKSDTRFAAYQRDFKYLLDRVNLKEHGSEPAEQVLQGKNGYVTAKNTLTGAVQVNGYAPVTNGSNANSKILMGVIIGIEEQDAYAGLSTIWSYITVTCSTSIFVVLIIGGMIGHYAAVSVKDLTHTMTSLASGDITVDVPCTKRSDEIGDIARAVQIFKDNAIALHNAQREQEAQQLKAEQEKKAYMQRLADEFHKNVYSVLDKFSIAVTEIGNKIKSMANNVDTSHKGATRVSKSADQTFSNVNTVAAAVEEFSMSIQEISKQVTQCSSIAQHAVEQSTNANTTINQLSVAAQKIGDVAQLINEITEKINLLSLNATIEAARAGDAGKGFAVVASEVKNLANQTATATEEIASHIHSIQEQTTNVVEVITDISKTINQMSELTTNIASAAQEQGATSQEIAHNVQFAANNTSEVSEAINDVVKATSSTEEASQHLIHTSQLMGEQFDSLKQQITKFLTDIQSS